MLLWGKLDMDYKCICWLETVALSGSQWFRVIEVETEPGLYPRPLTHSWGSFINLQMWCLRSVLGNSLESLISLPVSCAHKSLCSHHLDFPKWNVRLYFLKNLSTFKSFFPWKIEGGSGKLFPLTLALINLSVLLGLNWNWSQLANKDKKEPPLLPVSLPSPSQMWPLPWLLSGGLSTQPHPSSPAPQHVCVVYIPRLHFFLSALICNSSLYL